MLLSRYVLHVFLRKLSVVALLFMAQHAYSLGLGNIEVSSYLNEPLAATIPLVGTEGLNESELLIRLASQEAFDRSNLDRDFLLTQLKFSVDLKAKPAVIYVTTEKPVREPFLDFLLDIQSPKAQLIKEYTILLDLN